MFQPPEERKHGEAQAPAKVLDADSQLLLDAAEILRVRGQCKGKFGLPDGRVCMIGAIRVAAGFRPDSRIGHRVTIGATKKLRTALGRVIHEWNDDPKVGLHEACAKLREVALS